MVKEKQHTFLDDLFSWLQSFKSAQVGKRNFADCFGKVLQANSSCSGRYINHQHMSCTCLQVVTRHFYVVEDNQPMVEANALARMHYFFLSVFKTQRVCMQKWPEDEIQTMHSRGFASLATFMRRQLVTEIVVEIQMHFLSNFDMLQIRSTVKSQIL